MASVTWPASFLLAVLVVCTAGLTWKGFIPIHVFFTVGGLILGYLIPKGGGPLSLGSSGRQQREPREPQDDESDQGTFTREEIPTRKTVPDTKEAKKDE